MNFGSRLEAREDLRNVGAGLKCLHECLAARLGNSTKTVNEVGLNHANVCVADGQVMVSSTGVMPVYKSSPLSKTKGSMGDW